MMAGFTEVVLSKKLADLNSSQQSIQTLSLWLIHHRKHHAIIVKVWFKELQKAKGHRKLTFMYLANDVIQNSKKKGPEFGKEFGNVLRKSFENIAGPENDEKTLKSLGRILTIWEDRGVYDGKLIKELKKVLEVSSDDNTPPKKKTKTTDGTSLEDDKYIKKEKTAKVKPSAVERAKNEIEVEVEVDGVKEVHVTLSPKPPAQDPPEPEELYKALMDLANSASSDAVVRERISSFPEKLTSESIIQQIKNKAEAEALLFKINDILPVVTDYNSRLSIELQDRKKVSGMMINFIEAQKQMLAQLEKNLDEYSEKLQKLIAVRQELKSHIQNLPDLTQLPDVTGGLAPLPSAGDLFRLQ